MNMIELKSAIKGALTPDYTKFSQAQADEAVIKGIFEVCGLSEDSSAREIRAHQDAIFALIEEAIEAELPKAIEDVIGGYAEVKTFARDAEPVFTLKGVGKNRARMAITEGARGGIYKARRVTNKVVAVDVKAETVAAYVTLEDILLGRMSLAELMANIRDGFVEKTYIKTVEALRTAKALAPAANCTEANNIADLDKLVRIAGGYGAPVILGFKSAISKLNNGNGWSLTPNVGNADLDDVRNRGYVAMYKGTPVIELPNYLADEANTKFVFDERDIFILPTDSKPVKVAMKGDLQIIETQHPSGSVEQNAHRLMGVALVLANSVCVYTDSTASDGSL